jgi:hypothetical protein
VNSLNSAQSREPLPSALKKKEKKVGFEEKKPVFEIKSAFLPEFPLIFDV